MKYLSKFSAYLLVLALLFINISELFLVFALLNPADIIVMKWHDESEYTNE